jgi:hypothetical protein
LKLCAFACTFDFSRDFRFLASCFPPARPPPGDFRGQNYFFQFTYFPFVIAFFNETGQYVRQLMDTIWHLKPPPALSQKTHTTTDDGSLHKQLQNDASHRNLQRNHLSKRVIM